MLILIFLVLFSFFGKAYAKEACLFCHQGLSSISTVKEMAALACSFCHEGNPKSKIKEEAHRGLVRNPTDLRVVEETCGLCHAEIVARVKKSLHATSAGLISGARYTWGAQKTPLAIYAVKDVRDDDASIPSERGALRELFRLPSFDPEKPLSPTNHPVDDYLRAECLRCHLWTRGRETYGDFRASGCAACHVIYADDGRYVGKDQSLIQSPRPRMQLHRLTKKIPVFQCLHCHNRGGRTGVSFVGLMESAGYGAPWGTKPGQKKGLKVHGKYYDCLLPDIHYEKGLACIDCHTGLELHGDGNLYSKKEEAVEIECENCHGNLSRKALLRTEWGNPLSNVRRIKGKTYLFSKIDGRRHEIPQVKDVVANKPLARAAMTPFHLKRLECYACHASWAPQCYGCHVQQDLSEKSGDWLCYRPATDPSFKAREGARLKKVFRWRETRSYLRWENPALGINAEGKVAPFIPGCQVIFTQVGPGRNPKFTNHVFRTADGTFGLATNPIQPHTVRPRARGCASCHASSKALGLGEGIYRPRANGLPVPFELERFVTPAGKPLQAVSHPGARPFTREEMAKINRALTCVACHSLQASELKALGKAPDDATHLRLIRKILTQALDKKEE